MTSLAFEYFWCDVVGCAANSSLLLAIEVQFGCQAEITQFRLHFVVQEDVAELKVSVDDSVVVQVLDAFENSDRNEDYFLLCESLPSSQHFVQTVLRAEFKDQVNVLSVLEEVLEADHVLMLD